MYHSITFGEKNTWDDWHLVPSSRPVFLPPEQKVMQIDIPGGDGVINMSETLTGYPIYNNRKGSIEFIVMYGDGYGSWATRYSEIMDYLHGRSKRAILKDDDPFFFYEGRFFVSSWVSNPDGTGSRITIDYDLAPYKLALQSSTESWLWDPFSFETGIIQNVFGGIEIDSDDWVEYDFTKMIGRKPVVPKFTVIVTEGDTIDAQLYVRDLSINWRERHMTTGSHTYYDYILVELYETNANDANPTVKMKFKGHGVVSIDFRRGGL